jgi:hypothetical protein
VASTASMNYHAGYLSTGTATVCTQRTFSTQRAVLSLHILHCSKLDRSSRDHDMCGRRQFDCIRKGTGQTTKTCQYCLEIVGVREGLLQHLVVQEKIYKTIQITPRKNHRQASSRSLPSALFQSLLRSTLTQPPTW